MVSLSLRSKMGSYVSTRLPLAIPVLWQKYQVFDSIQFVSRIINGYGCETLKSRI